MRGEGILLRKDIHSSFEGKTVYDMRYTGRSCYNCLSRGGKISLKRVKKRQTCMFKKVKNVPYAAHHRLWLGRVKPPWAVTHVNSIIKRFYEFDVLGERQIFGIQVGNTSIPSLDRQAVDRGWL